MLKNKKIIKEICIKLNLKIEMINDVFKYFDTFLNNNSSNFLEEVVIASCIYLSSKINEDFKRIRDIINVIYFVKSKYEKISNAQENSEIIHNLIDDNYSSDNDVTLIKTMHSLTIENYYILRDEILKAEQHLLRLISYVFESRSKETYLMLLNYADYLEFSSSQIQYAWSILNSYYENEHLPEINLFLGKYEIENIDSLIVCSIMFLLLEMENYFNNKNDNSDSNLALLKKLNLRIKSEDIINVSNIIFRKLCFAKLK